MSPEQPFALFSGATYYPAPGWQGHCGQFATIEDAAVLGKKMADEMFGWWQVVDLRELKIVAGEGSGHTGLFGACPAFVPTPDSPPETVDGEG